MSDEKNDNDDLLSEAKAEYERCHSAENDNRLTFLEDMRFGKLGDQWPEDVKKDREASDRPCLTINKMNSFVRQVVNDSRQNKPSISVKPVDSNADPKTAEIISGLIRNIEHVSSADVAYDTAVENAVGGGFGYIRVGADYAFDDGFDMDIQIERVLDPLSVCGDPDSTAADGSDWNVAFVSERISKDKYKKLYGGDAPTDFSADAWASHGGKWINEDGVLITEYWKREEIETEIVLLSDGRVFPLADIENNADLQTAINAGTITIANQRVSKSYKVTQTILSGEKVLETEDWPGRYIPIIPVYGDEFSIEGKRYFRSLINPAKDAQRMFNYWRTAATELVALAPRVPWVGEEGTFDADDNWQDANTSNLAFLEYKKGSMPPQRQPLDSGTAAGAMQEALNASDDMKSITGLHDASLGARSNETSGRAILARQREGDISTFHFIDNLSRSIRHVGRVIIDLIPHYYSAPRIVRILGEDGSEEAVKVNQPFEQQDENGEALQAIYDLTVGKYDLAVSAGPSFTTRREEAAAQMTDLIRAYPAAAPIVADLMAKNFDWPGADELAKRFEKMLPEQVGEDQVPPQIRAQIEDGVAKLKAQADEIEALKKSRDTDMAELKIKEYEAKTERLKILRELDLDLSFLE